MGAVLVTIGCVPVGCSPGPDRSRTIETFESGTSPRVRVTVHPDRGFFGGGSYYRFEALPLRSGVWKEVATFVHDFAGVYGPIPRNQIRAVGDGTVYFFIGWLYAVTTDGGHSWSVWTAKENLPNWECCNYGLIRDVSLRDDGSGTMILNPIPGRSGEVPALYTKDFGRTWHSTKI